jgi:hypothetical protein
MKDKSQISLDLFPKPVVKHTRYYDLNINQRINVKANSCGFHEAYLLSPWKQIYRWDKAGELLYKWYEHHKLNQNRLRPKKKTLF